MNVKLLGIFTLIIILSTFVLAANPVITGASTTSREYVVAGDRNYYDFNTIWYSGTITDADGDLNTLSCEMSNNGGITWYSSVPTVDFNLSDVNRCKTTLNYEWGVTDDVNIAFRIKDLAGGTGTQVTWKVWWLDNTAPTTAPNTPSGNPPTVILTSTDDATTSGDGVGVKLTYYWVDSGARQTSLTNPTSFTVTGNTNHTVNWCSVDNFDNNECISTGILSKQVYVGTISTGTCALVPLINLILVASALLALVVGVVLAIMTEGGVREKMLTAISATGAMIAVVLIIYIIGLLILGVC